MAAGIEREVKLQFADPASARETIGAAGGTRTSDRRLQRDALLDTAGGMLRDARSVLRVREDGAGRAFITFKGPVQPSTMKLREEIETAVADAGAVFTLLDRLGFRVWFRYEKFREEFSLHDCSVSVDETPVGTFVEIEGDEVGIALAARALGKAPDDYVLDSYRGLYVRRCGELGVDPGDMVFDAAARA